MRAVGWDAVVVGAGPAGSTAAYLMAAQGLRVILLDRSEFPRKKLCGGLLTWKTLNCLARLFGLSPQGLAEHGILHYTAHDYRICSASGRLLTGRLDHPFHFVDRERYDDHLLHRALSAGAVFESGADVTHVDANAVTLASGRRHTGRFILAADGVNSRVRKRLIRCGRLTPIGAPGVAAALECRADDDHVSGPELHYGWIPWGYAWSFPGRDHRLLGMAVLRDRAGSRLRCAFRRFLRRARPDGPTPRIQAHLIPYGNYLPRPGCADILLVGDAAGFADPFLGEGIYYAHRSAELAARAVVDCRSNRSDAAEFYGRWCRQEILPALRRVHVGRRLVFALPPRLYFPVLTLLLRLQPSAYEASIQGLRSRPKHLRPR